MEKNIISGKTVLSSYDKQLLTDVSISKTKIDLGTFSWNDAQEDKWRYGVEPTVLSQVRKHLDQEDQS